MQLVRDAVGNGHIPSAALAYGRGSSGSYRRAFFGAGEDAVYDLASLTKVVATLPAVLRLVDVGEVGLDDRVRRYVPEFVGSGKNEVTIRHLLSHTSGLPADRVISASIGHLEDPCGTVVRYSDVGFHLLARVVEAVTGQSLDAAVSRLVLEPLGMRSTRFLPPAEWIGRIMPTEGDKLGVVHDENAEALGGVAGHAGLFGTVDDLAKYLRQGWLDANSPILSGKVREQALKCQTDGLNGRRGLGWVLSGDPFDHMTDAWPASRAGHTGFTGTSVAMDPVSGMWAVLLTNAVHYGRNNSIKELRRQVHAAIAVELGTG